MKRNQWSLFEWRTWRYHEDAVFFVDADVDGRMHSRAVKSVRISDPLIYPAGVKTRRSSWDIRFRRFSALGVRRVAPRQPVCLWHKITPSHGESNKFVSYNLSTQTPSYLSSFASLAFLYFLLVHHDISPSSPRRAIFSPCENTCEPGHATGRHTTKPSFLERKLPKIWVRSKAPGTGCVNYRVKIERIIAYSLCVEKFGQKIDRRLAWI